MPQPTLRDVHTDAILTNVLVSYMNRGLGFVAPRVFPIVSVDKQSDRYYVYPKGDWFRDEAQKRRSGAESVGSGYTLSSDTYYADVWAIHKDIDDQLRWNADPAIDLERDATEFVALRILMRMEREWTSTFFTSGVWGTDSTPAALWDDYASSDPIGDILTASTTMLQATGYRPNKLVLGLHVFNALMHHPDIIDRYKYTQSAAVTEQLLAQLFRVNEVIVAEGVYNAAQEGATDDMQFIHGKHALLVYAPERAGLQVASAGYTFAWRNLMGSIGKPAVVRKFRMEPIRSDRIEGEAAWDHKVVATDLGYYFNSVVS
jgi:PAS domain-containing protein